MEKSNVTLASNAGFLKEADIIYFKGSFLRGFLFPYLLAVRVFGEA